MVPHCASCNELCDDAFRMHEPGQQTSNSAHTSVSTEMMAREGVCILNTSLIKPADSLSQEAFSPSICSPQELHRFSSFRLNMLECYVG